MSAACDRGIGFSSQEYCGPHCHGWCLLSLDPAETCAKLCALGPVELPEPPAPESGHLQVVELGPVSGDGIARLGRTRAAVGFSVWANTARRA